MSEAYIQDMKVREATKGHEAATPKAGFDFDHLKKLCVCERFKTEGFDYGQIHPNLGKCGVGLRWTPPREQIEFLEKKYIALEEENRKLKFMIDNGLGWGDMRNDATYPNG